MFHVKPKLSRKQIKEGLSQIPMETLLLGTSKVGERLTHKQKEFARLVALGENKTKAYREAYNSTGKPEGQTVSACRLSQKPSVALMIEAYQLANEAAKYRTPAQLRELVIHQLTQHALDTDCPPAQRIKALELLGKVSEVAAFTERKETTIVNQSSEIKARLLESLRNVVDVQDISPKGEDDAAQLMAELQDPANGGENCESEAGDTHRTPTPIYEAGLGGVDTHTTPHEQIGSNSDPHIQMPSAPHEQPHSDSPLDSSLPDGMPIGGTPSLLDRNGSTITEYKPHPEDE